MKCLHTLNLLETPLDLSSPAKPPTTAPQLSRAPSPGRVGKLLKETESNFIQGSYFNLLHIQTNRRLRSLSSLGL
uniref:Uncharacterized protein n=1 Tax=Neogobius melanostomus TaxID=47308 RepID=A0A8C6SP59_9GOBI